MSQELIQSWGRIGSWPHDLIFLNGAIHQLPSFARNIKGLPYGNGRSYGDVCLNPGGGLWNTSALDKFSSFDLKTGVLACEAGVFLGDIQSLAIPRGWILPVSPGTQFVTVGGAIANDVHGKNHHRKATFGNHLKKIELLRTDGSYIECSPNLHSELFYATIGGLGLTGVILKAYIQLMPVESSCLESESIPFRGVREFMELSDASEQDWEYTVSWIDCLSGRSPDGIFLRANHSARANQDNRIANLKHHMMMPCTPPFSLVNKFTLRPFNFLYKNFHKLKPSRQIVDYQSFFYPLDIIVDWNKIYGPRGFYQYQSVIPRLSSIDAIENMLTEISSCGVGSFLAVLKTFSYQKSLGMLSFAQPGLTLALDFPNKGEVTSKLFGRLDAIVAEAGGRLYPAKDMMMSRSMFEAGYPRLKDFLPYRDPGISSSFSKRVMGF